MQVAVDLADIDADCFLIDSQAGFDASLEADMYAVVYQCEDNNVVLNGAFVFDRSPLIVANVVTITASDPGMLLLALLTQGIPAIAEDDEEAILAETLGPSVGQQSQWYLLTKETRGLHYDGYLTAFTEGPGAVFVFCGGFRGQNSLKCTEDLAQLVAARIRAG